MNEGGARLGFDRLDRLRVYTENLMVPAPATLELFRAQGAPGFRHMRDVGDPDDFSRSSTATCVAFLVAAGLWNGEAWAEDGQPLIDAITDPNFKWESAGLAEDNAYTVAFLLEALADLQLVGGHLSDEQQQVVADKAGALVAALKDGIGGIGIEDAPATAFLSHKVVHALDRWDGIPAEVEELVRQWAWARLHAESVLISATRPDRDVFELAYALLTIAATQSLDDMTPRERQVLRHALAQFFRSQLPEGTWPRSRPLFLYPKFGYAYCYDYELLVQMLSQPRLRRWLLEWLPNLEAAAYALDAEKYVLEDDGQVGWSSGHLVNATRPESWSTASVFHFCHLLLDVVAEAVRVEVFEYAGSAGAYREPSEERGSGAIGLGFLDARVEQDGQDAVSLRAALNDGLVKPIVADLALLRRGKPIRKGTAVSAILYGPPGTSKTQLARLISEALGWPLLALDPSHLTRQGLDSLHMETDRLFGMLAALERVVVLFDEFDELVREREMAASEALSRFLTTAMLPKLKALADRRRIVYLLATNHVENFDPAIQRPGRFDMIVPVMPPTAEEKLRRDEWKPLADVLQEADITRANDAPVWGELDDFTFDEFDVVARRVSGVAADGDDPDLRGRITAAIHALHARCTLRQSVAAAADAEAVAKTWADQMVEQRGRIRLPHVN